MSVSAVGSSTSSLAAAARAAAAQRGEGRHHPMDANQDGLVTRTEAYEYTLDRPELRAAEATGVPYALAGQPAGAIQQAATASVKAATGLDLMG
jgi:hypothetical protein